MKDLKDFIMENDWITCYSFPNYIPHNTELWFKDGSISVYIKTNDTIAYIIGLDYFEEQQIKTFINNI